MGKAHLMYEYCDAKTDMLRKLNVLTDEEKPCFKDVQAMYLYAKAIKELQEAEHIAATMPEMDNGVAEYSARAK